MGNLLTLLMAGRWPPRALIEGDDAQVEAYLNRLAAVIPQPIYRSSLPGPLPLSQLKSGSLILSDVSGLSRLQQRELCEWLDHQTGTVFLLALSSKPLFDRVQEGAFDEQLYYRLNIVLETLPDVLRVT
jgi:sigma-54-interacting transcriptional regulator